MAAWLLGYPWFHVRRIGLGKFLGWLDLNLLAGLERSILRPLFRYRLPGIGLAAMADVTHRIGRDEFA
jgi:hypothetical protein